MVPCNILHDLEIRTVVFSMLIPYQSIDRSCAVPVATARSRHRSDVQRGCDMWYVVMLWLLVLANVAV
jgi:hypothetical protein